MGKGGGNIHIGNSPLSLLNFRREENSTGMIHCNFPINPLAHRVPSHFHPDLKFPEFLCEFSFHLEPTFPRYFHPPTTNIPGDSPQNPCDFARRVVIVYIFDFR